MANRKKIRRRLLFIGGLGIFALLFLPNLITIIATQTSKEVMDLSLPEDQLSATQGSRQNQSKKTYQLYLFSDLIMLREKSLDSTSKPSPLFIGTSLDSLKSPLWALADSSPQVPMMRLKIHQDASYNSLVQCLEMLNDLGLNKYILDKASDEDRTQLGTEPTNRSLQR